MEMYLVLNAENKKELFFNPKDERLIKNTSEKEIESIPVNIDDFTIDNLKELKSDIKDSIHKTGKHIHQSLNDIEKLNGSIDESTQNVFALGEPLDENIDEHLIIEVDENIGVRIIENNNKHIEIEDMNLENAVKVKDAVDKYSMMYDIISENIE
ncbi:MAG: hypothetical protein ACOCRK_06040 [bacterium]